MLCKMSLVNTDYNITIITSKQLCAGGICLTKYNTIKVAVFIVIVCAKE